MIAIGGQFNASPCGNGDLADEAILRHHRSTPKPTIAAALWLTRWIGGGYLASSMLLTLNCFKQLITVKAKNDSL